MRSRITLLRFAGLVLAVIIAYIFITKTTTKILNCTPEYTFLRLAEEDKLDFVSYAELTSKQQEIVTEQWQKELERLRSNSEKIPQALEKLKRKNPERYAEIKAYMQPMDPNSHGELPNVNAVRSWRFSCE